MGLLDFLRGGDREQFTTWTGADTAFAAWLRGDTDGSSELVTPYTVLGLSAIIRGVSVISTTIASLPLRTYEKGEDGSRQRIDSVFDDPFPGIDGMTPFSWVETIVIHELLWRHAFLWHEDRDARGFVNAYRPVVPDAFSKVERVGGKRRFTYRDADGEEHTVGSETLTYIPGPSIDGVQGHPLLEAAKPIFSGALSGDKAAATTLRRGIRLAGLVVPEGDEVVESEEAEQILEQLRGKVVGREHSGDVAVINKRMKLQPWTPTNIESQWNETRLYWLGEAGRILGIPPHLLNDTEKQTSWGTGVAEQNLGLARYTLMGWTTRIEQALSQRLPEGQFVEFDYAGLLQGTPAEEIRLLIEQVDAGLLTIDEARRIRNLPPLTPAQKAEAALRTGTARSVTDPQENSV